MENIVRELKFPSFHMVLCSSELSILHVAPGPKLEWLRCDLF